jgi:uncharacterized protein (TIGR02270 family)
MSDPLFGVGAPIWDVLEEHLEEAGFLWTQREQALASPRWTIAEVAAGPEERLLAHLGGLALGGANVEEELLAPAVADADAGKVAVATSALAARGRLDLVRGAVKQDAPGSSTAIVRGLAFAAPAAAQRALLGWLDAPEPHVQAIAVAALASRGAAPERAVRLALGSSDPTLLAAGLRAAAALGDGARAEIEASWASPHPGVHDAGVEAGLAIGLRGAWSASRRAADAGEASALDLLVLAASGARGDIGRIVTAAGVATTRGAALFAAGFSGWSEAAELCVTHLGDPAVAGVAGEAFEAVTGLAIEGLYAAPEPNEPDPYDDGAEAGPSVGPEAELPQPDAMEVASWWREQRARFAEGRWVEGRPYGSDALLRVFLGGSTRRRGPIARELAIRSMGQYRLDTGAPASEQLRRATELRLEARADFGQSFEKLLRV